MNRLRVPTWLRVALQVGIALAAIAYLVPGKEPAATTTAQTIPDASTTSEPEVLSGTSTTSTTLATTTTATTSTAPPVTATKGQGTTTTPMSAPQLTCKVPAIMVERGASNYRAEPGANAGSGTDAWTLSPPWDATLKTILKVCNVSKDQAQERVVAVWCGIDPPFPSRKSEC